MGLLRSRSQPPAEADRRVAQDFVRALSVIVDPRQLHSVIVAQLQEIFELERVALVLRDEDAGGYRVVEERSALPPPPPSRLAWPDEARLVRWLRVNEETLQLAADAGIDEYVGAGEAERLGAEGFRTIVPLVAMNRLTGFLLLGGGDGVAGGRRAGRSRRARDGARLELLEQFAGQAALACENAALLAAQRARLRRLYRAERLATAGELAAGAAHEIRNPLTAIRSTIQYLHETLPGDHPGRTEAAGLLEEVDRINEIVEGLRSFARPREAVFARLDAAEVARQSLALVAGQARKQGVEVTAELAEPVALVGDEGLLKQLFLNLLLNAVQAMPEGGRLTVAGRPLPARRGGPAERGGGLFEIADSGPGIPEEIRERVFDPFFTTKSGGTGLGLSICYGIAERHRGEIEIFGSEVGTTVRVRLRGGEA